MPLAPDKVVLRDGARTWVDKQHVEQIMKHLEALRQRHPFAFRAVGLALNDPNYRVPEEHREAINATGRFTIDRQGRLQVSDKTRYILRLSIDGDSIVRPTLAPIAN